VSAACPARAAGPAEAAPVPGAGEVTLQLPGLHCAGCVSAAERALLSHPAVAAARVNLTLRRAVVSTGGGADAEGLVRHLAAKGIEAHELDAGRLDADGDARDLLIRLGVAGFAMMNVMLLSVAVWSGAADATRQLFHLISAAIAIPAVIYAARPFAVSALGALRGGRLNMDVPITLAIGLALLMSVHEARVGGHHAWFDAALSLTFFLLAGRYLERRARHAARSAAAELAALEVDRATLLVDGAERVVETTALRPGDVVRVRPGQRVPVDARIERGASETDRSALTGETVPADVAPGCELAAGEVNLTGPLDLRVLRAGEDSALARMTRLVAAAEAARSRHASLADRAARIYAPAVHLLALAALVGWWAGTVDLHRAIGVAVAVLIITCPCALGLAVPAVGAAASGRLFRRGVMLKSDTALERLAEIDTVVFDKTGTLTEGRPVLEGEPDPAALALAAGLARGSVHPLSRALVEAAEARGVVPAEAQAVAERPGLGVEGLVGGRRVRLGRAAWIGAPEGGGTACWLDAGGEARAFRFRDAARPGAAEAVAGLRRLGLDVALLSGDGQDAVAALAREVGIEAFEAGVDPEGKARRVEAMTAEGRRVLMVGDGLNDTAALASAHASISPASALDAARTASDAVVMPRSLAVLPEIVRTARAARRRMGENIALSTLYNAVAVPVALAGLATPLLAALAMSSSSILVSINALRLGR
jgi:Cu2+-exporting ATPase